MKNELTISEISQITGDKPQCLNVRAWREKWPKNQRPGKGRGGKTNLFRIDDLPADIRNKIIENMAIDGNRADLIDGLTPETALTVARRIMGKDDYSVSKTKKTAKSLDEDVLSDPRVARIARICQEAMDCPPDWKKRRWVEAIAQKNDISYQTIYKWLKKYEKEGLAGFKHTKSTKGKATSWSPEALDFWFGLCLKRAHRHMAGDALYKILEQQAKIKNWRIGSYRSAMWWYQKKVSPQLIAFQKSGYRGLDNKLPPILRQYADLQPFELLVGDQHRFDFWVIDDNTGEIFRPEGYLWQDLRTRLFYGCALDKRYDSQLIGLSLRMGINVFGAFGSIYTDNGKPELSLYIDGILESMKTLGLDARQEMDGDIEIREDAESVNPLAIQPGTRKKAIVKNAKAKMIEGTFNVLEGILRDHFRVPGSVKKLTDSGEAQEVDFKEIQRLGESGKLLSFWEFVGQVMKALDYYNKVKVHRGLVREWPWAPKKKDATPMDCLHMCWLDGWRPRNLRQEEVDSAFLARAKRPRVVDRGRIRFRGEIYEHDGLIALDGQKISIRFDPMEPDWVMAYHGGRCVGECNMVEYSSMVDEELANRKIREKARRRSAIIDEYRKLTKGIPDFMGYSRIEDKPKATKSSPEPEALPMAENDVKKAIKEMEELQNRPVFYTRLDRYEWLLAQAASEGVLTEEDLRFIEKYEGGMDESTVKYYQQYKEAMNIKLQGEK